MTVERQVGTGRRDSVALRLWAKSKPRHPLWKHLLDASALSLALPNPVSGFDWSDAQVALVIGLHDIGKADAGFQHQVAEFSAELVQFGYPVTSDARCRHERLSARFIAKKLAEAGLDPFAAAAVARAVIAHHGYWDEAARDVGAEYEKAQKELCRVLEEALKVTEFPKKSPTDLSAFGIPNAMPNDKPGHFLTFIAQRSVS